MAADIKKWLGGDIAEFIVRFLVVATLIIGIVIFINQNNNAACQFTYNQAYAEYAESARFVKNAHDEVQDKLLKAIHDARSRNNTQTQKDIDAAFIEYFTTIELTNKQLAENPPPALPNDFC